MQKQRKVKVAVASGNRASDIEMAKPPVLTELTDPEIAARAYSYWEARGQVAGSAEEDWYRAIEELRAEMRRCGREATNDQD